MESMFYGCYKFNKPLNFNTSKVTNMASMFGSCLVFNQPLNFDTSRVTNMARMFLGCEDFNQPLNFDTSQVTNMASMFTECLVFNQELNFDTSRVTNMAGMFLGCEDFNQPLNFDTSEVTNMASMFYGCIYFNQELNFDTSRVTNMSQMFRGCENFNQPLNFDTTPVTNMSEMFKGCRNFNQELYFDITQVTNMDGIFDDCIQLNPATVERFRLRLPPPIKPQPYMANEYSDLLKKIIVFDPIAYDDVTAKDFLEENTTYIPFIIYHHNHFTGNAIKWPSNKLFIECKDDTPTYWRGNTYERYVKPGGKALVKLIIKGVTLMIVIPEWWKTQQPKSVFYKLKEAGKIHKFMAEELSRGLTLRELETYTALGSDHCNQTSNQTVYELEPMELHELEIMLMPEKLDIKSNRLINSFSRKTNSKNTKTRKSKLIEKTKKTLRRKSIGGKKITKKHKKS
jgi:surface protein